MEQLSFFAEAGQSVGLPKHLLDYRPGLLNISVAWHSDKEDILAKNPVIASLIFRQMRSGVMTHSVWPITHVR